MPRDPLLIRFGGHARSLGAWASSAGLSPRTLQRRLADGLALDAALSRPLTSRRARGMLGARAARRGGLR